VNQNTATSTTPSHGSLVALLTRPGASPGEAYNVAEEVANLTRLVATEMAEAVKMQVLSRIDALQGALEGLRSEVTARFKTIDQRFDTAVLRFDAIEQRFDFANQRLDSMERHFEQMHRFFGGIQSQGDYHRTGYRRLLLLLVIPVAPALLAGVGGMIWEGIANWSVKLP